MRGVTSVEFAALHNRRQGQQRQVPFETIQRFLERCCELGLLRREVGDDGVRRYVLTRPLFLAGRASQ